MNQASAGKDPSRPWITVADQQYVGPAGWLGVALVVAAALFFIVSSPRYSPESPQKKDQLGAVAAGYALAALWQRAPQDAEAFEAALTSGADFSATARMLGLQARSVRVTPSTIRETRYPMILLLKEDPDIVVTRDFLEGRQRKAGARYIVLAEVQDNEAVILDPFVGGYTMPVPDLVESVGDVGTMWRPNP